MGPDLAIRPWWNIGLGLLFGQVQALTPTCLVLRLLRPRPSLREVARQPGFVACLCGTAAYGVTLLTIGLVGLVRWIKSGTLTASGRPALTPDTDWWHPILGHFEGQIGPMVPGGPGCS